MIIAMQMLVFFRESILAVLNGWLPPLFTRFVRKLSRNGLGPEEDEIEEQVYAEYDDECGVVFFPSVHAQRYAAVCDCLMDERWFGKLDKVLTIGKHHDVNFMKYLAEVPGITQILGLDIECSLNCTCDMLNLFDDYGQIREELLQITLLQGNAADPDYRLIGCDAVVAIEMIQLLPPHDLDRLVHNVFGFVKPWVAIFSTPNADFNHFLKHLDKNGHRHSDHYFEWTRAQLHDWCSNIVQRYPDYTVVSRGVGPGPAGTSHYGCYSQLVLFISKNYKKEMELNVDSLVLVSDLPEPGEENELVWSTEVADMTSSSSLLPRIQEDGSTGCRYSDTTIDTTPFASPASSIMSFRRVDKSAQCNVDVELGKSFVMFSHEEYEIRMPRKRIYSNVYEMGDVACRLNNTMCEVKQFSKATQYLLEKNETDTSNAQDIMNEISQLTDKLSSNLNRSAGDGFIWNNVNWGENVPYWNQYYKVLGVFNYPCEERSEDDVILDLLLEEINRMHDIQLEAGMGQSQFDIPIDRLMDAVKHITYDVERVVNILEDNGYELDGEFLVLPGLDANVGDEEDTESYTDVETISNESTPHDFNGALDRAVCRKIKKLQSMLSNDKEIRQVLSHVICRLKKLALISSHTKEGPMRSKWLQSRLLDLLTMTEKSILRRNSRSIERDSLRGLGYDTGDETASHLTRIKAEDDTAMRIVAKYQNILRKSAGATDSKDNLETQFSYGSDLTDIVDSEYDSYKPSAYKFTYDTENATSLFTETDYFEEHFQESEVLSSSLNEEFLRYAFDEFQICKLLDWEEKYTNIYQESNIYQNCCGITLKKSKTTRPRNKIKLKNSLRSVKKCSTNRISNKKLKQTHRHDINVVVVNNVLKNTYSSKNRDIKKSRRATTGKALRNLIFSNELEYIEEIDKINKPSFLSVAPKPIPDSIIDLCRPELSQKTVASVGKANYLPDDTQESPVSASQELQIIEILSQNDTVTVSLQRMVGTNPDGDAEVHDLESEQLDLTSLLTEASCEMRTAPAYSQDGEEGQRHNVILNDAPGATPQELNAEPVAVTQKTRIVEILTQDKRELVSLQRTVGTDPDTEVKELGHSKLKSSLIDPTLREKDTVGTGNDSFFLYDINEPTTSKGVRHVSTDVQCGADNKISKYALLSATTSFTTPFNMLDTEIKLDNSIPDAVDCVTSAYDIVIPCVPKSSLRMKSVGIKIKDSDHKIADSPNERKENESVDERIIDAHCANTNNKSIEIDSTPTDNVATHVEKSSNLENHTNETTSNLAKSVDNIKRSVCSTIPKPIVNGSKAPNTKVPESLATAQCLRQPNDTRPALSCGGVHVHSYKDLQVSEDVVYQGEWQRHRPKPLRNIYRKPIDFTTYKTKYTRKINSPKPIEKTVQPPNTAPNTIRNTQASKLKENINKINLQNKLNSAKLQVSNTTPKAVPKATPKLAVNHSKSVKKNSKTKIQPTRQTKFLSQTIIAKENKAPSNKTSYVPPYLKKMSKKPEIAKTPSKSKVKSDSQSNLSKLNNDHAISISLPKTETLISALLKVSIEPKEKVTYAVYRNETETSKYNTTVEKIPISARSSDKENVLKRKLSSLAPDGSAGSSYNRTATVLNAQPVSRPKSLKERRQPLLIKPSLIRKSSDSKMISRIKKLANKIISSKKTRTNDAIPGNISGTSTLLDSSSKHDVNVKLVLKPSVKKSLVNSSDGKNKSIASCKSVESLNTETSLIIEFSKSIRPNQALVENQDPVALPNESSLIIKDSNVTSDLINHSHETTNYNSDIDEMKRIINLTSDSINHSHATTDHSSNINEMKRIINVTSDSINHSHATTDHNNNIDEMKRIINVTSDSINHSPETTNHNSNIDEMKRIINVTSDSINHSHATTDHSSNINEMKRIINVTSDSINHSHATTDHSSNINEMKRIINVTSDTINHSHVTIDHNSNIDEMKRIINVASDSINHSHAIDHNSNIDEMKRIINVTSDSINHTHEITDHNSNIDEMKRIIEESLIFLDEPDIRDDSETANVNNLDIENFTTTESDTYMTTISYQPGDVLSPNRMQSFTDFSFKSVSSLSKLSECFADNESCNISSHCHNGGKIQDIQGSKETFSITRKPGPVFSAFSMNPELRPMASREPDYVNLIDSETGSYAVGAIRLTTSEEVLVSGRTSQSYVSCVLDEEADVPSWLFHNQSHQASGSTMSQQHIYELPVDMPEPFDLGYDENGNELAVQGAGAGDGHGVHSDQSQDSSGHGTSSSSVSSSRVNSESIVLDPETFAAQMEASRDHASTSNVPSRPESIDTSFTTAIENQTLLRVPNRSQSPRSSRRESLPASDADISSIDTDVASD